MKTRIGDKEYIEIQHFQYLDGSGRSYHLLIPADTRMIRQTKDKNDKIINMEPVSSISEFQKKNTEIAK